MSESRGNAVPRGHITLVARHKDGEVFAVRETSNIVTNGGLAALSGCIIGQQTTDYKYLAVGTDATAPAATDTALGSELTTAGMGRASDSGPAQSNDGGVTNDTAVLDYVWTATDVATVNEIGVFNSSSGGTMAAHGTVTQVSLTTSDTLTGTYKITLATA
jgi:hypothetical protein